jgi:hypothetical protein
LHREAMLRGMWSVPPFQGSFCSALI